MIRSSPRWPRRLPAGLCAIGLTLLMAAWVVGTQPFGAPDEASHYLRALSIANGHLLGPKIRYPNVAASPAQLAFANHDTHAVEVPAALSPPDVLCVDGKPDLHGHCVEATPTGDYYPPGYLLPALSIKLESNASSALWLSRWLSAALCAVLLVLAVAMLWDGTGWSVLGLLAGITPMVLFVGSILNPSGLETAASIACAAACLRIARDRGAAPAWIWIALAFGGALTVVSFQAGPAFLVADLAVAAALLGRDGLLEVRRTRRDWLVRAGLVLVLAIVAWFVYARISGANHSHFGITPIRASLSAGFGQLGPVLRDAIGTFGSLTVPLPTPARWFWWSLVLVLVGAGMWLGSTRERVLMIGVLLLALAFPLLSYAWIYRYSGFGMQGRQVLPVLILLPLTAGELARRHMARIPRQLATWGLGVTIAAIALFQVYAWWYDAHVVAGAPGTLRFYAHATWKPPLGWIPWIVVACAGTLALLIFAASLTVRGSRLRAAPSG